MVGGMVTAFMDGLHYWWPKITGRMYPEKLGQFDDLPQQQEAATLGMWTFLATEILSFGGLFLSSIVYRSNYPQAFAEASIEVLGTDRPHGVPET
jgi:heme/copper-type cytochrome/quinol oxidase subunit 1